MAKKRPKNIGEKLKARRLELRLRQVDVAILFGVHRGSVQNWERGVHTPDPSHAARIVEFLACDPFGNLVVL